MAEIGRGSKDTAEDWRELERGRVSEWVGGCYASAAVAGYDTAKGSVYEWRETRRNIIIR